MSNVDSPTPVLCFTPGCTHARVYLEREPSRGCPGSGRWATRWGRLGGPLGGLSWWSEPEARAPGEWAELGPPDGTRLVCAVATSPGPDPTPCPPTPSPKG